MAGPVLLIHDDVSVVAPAKRALQRQGIDTLLVTNAADAVITFGDLSPRVVVLAPDVDGGRGDAILAQIRSHPRGAQTRFVLLGRPLALAPDAAVVELPLDGQALVVAVERALEGDDVTAAWHLSEPTGTEDSPGLPVPPSSGALAASLFADLADPSAASSQVPLDSLFGDWARAAAPPSAPSPSGAASAPAAEPEAAEIDAPHPLLELWQVKSAAAGPAVLPAASEGSAEPPDEPPDEPPQEPDGLARPREPAESERSRALARDAEDLSHRLSTGRSPLAEVDQLVRGRRRELEAMKRGREGAESQAGEASGALERERATSAQVADAAVGQRRVAEEALAAAASARRELEAEIQGLEESRASLEAEVGELRAVLGERQRARATAAQERADSERLFSELAEEARNEVEQSRAQRAAKAAELEALTRERELAEADAAGLDETMRGQTDALARIHSQGEALRAERCRLEEACAAALAEVAQSERELAALSAQRQVLGESREGSKARIERLRQELADGAPERALEDAQRSLEELRERGRTQKAGLEALRAAAAEEEARQIETRERLESELGELTGEAQEQRRRAQDLAEAREAQTKRIADLSLREEDLETELALALAAAVAGESRLEALRGEIQAARARLGATDEAERAANEERTLLGDALEAAERRSAEQPSMESLRERLAREGARGLRLAGEMEARLSEGLERAQVERARIEAAAAELSGQEAALGELQRQFAQVEGQRAAALERAQIERARIEAAAAELSGQEAALGELQRHFTQVEAQRSAALERAQAEREQAEATRAELAAQEDSLSQALAQRLAAEVEAHRLQSAERARAARAQAEAARSQRSAQEAALAEEQARAEESCRQAADLDAKLAEVRARAQAAREALEAPRAELASRQDELAAQEAQVEEVQQQSAELEEKRLAAVEWTQAERARLEGLRAEGASQEAALAEERAQLEAQAQARGKALEEARVRAQGAQKAFEEQRAALEQEEERARERAEFAAKEARDRADRRALSEREQEVRKAQEERRLEQEAIRKREAEAAAQPPPQVPESRPRLLRPLASRRGPAGEPVAPMSLGSPSAGPGEAEQASKEAAGPGPEEGFKSTPPALPTAPPFAPRGTLSQLDAPSLLCRAFESRLTGRIDVAGLDAQRTLWFEEGRLVAAASGSAVERLEEIALRSALVTRAQHHALRTSEEKQARRLALQMVELGYLRASEMYPLVRRRVLEIAFSVFLDDDSAYVFTAESPPAEERVVLPLHPYALATEGIRRKFSADRLWARLGGPATLLRPREKGLELDYFGLSARERRLAAKVDGLRTIEEVLFEGGLDEVAALKVLYALVTAGALEIAVLGAAAGLKGAGESARLELSRVGEKYSQVLAGDYFQMLGLRRDATGYEVRESYERLAREFHPDRFLGLEDAPLLSRLDEIGRALAEAVDVLADDAVREEYARNLVE